MAAIHEWHEAVMQAICSKKALLAPPTMLAVNSVRCRYMPYNLVFSYDFLKRAVQKKWFGFFLKKSLDLHMAVFWKMNKNVICVRPTFAPFACLDLSSTLALHLRPMRIMPQPTKTRIYIHCFTLHPPNFNGNEHSLNNPSQISRTPHSHQQNRCWDYLLSSSV